MKAIETDLAVNSSGFSTGGFVRWYGAKYGNTEDWENWIKLHVMAGATTHIFMSVGFSARYTHDGKFFDLACDGHGSQLQPARSLGEQGVCAPAHL